MSIPPNVAFPHANANIPQPSPAQPSVNESVPPERPNRSLFAPETSVGDPAVIPAPSLDASRSLPPSGVPAFASRPVPASRYRPILPAIQSVIQSDKHFHRLISHVSEAAIHAHPGTVALQHSPTSTALPFPAGRYNFSGHGASIQRSSPAAPPQVMQGAGRPYELEEHDAGGVLWQISSVNILAFQFRLLEMQIAAFGALL